MRVAEIYHSVQGEGFLTGTPSVFVRTSGCNLRCWYCDTPYTSWDPEGDDLPVDEIVSQMQTHDCTHVVVTGGEPMVHAELIPLCARLSASGSHVTIETAGTLHLPLVCDLMSISPKLSASAPPADQLPHWQARHERTRHTPEVVRSLISEHTYQIKFVIDSRSDCDETESYLAEIPEIDRRRVLLMPQGTTIDQLARVAEWLEPYCKQFGLQFCPRKQIEWFGLTRRT